MSRLRHGEILPVDVSALCGDWTRVCYWTLRLPSRTLLEGPTPHRYEGQTVFTLNPMKILSEFHLANVQVLLYKGDLRDSGHAKINLWLTEGNKKEVNGI